MAISSQLHSHGALPTGQVLSVSLAQVTGWLTAPSWTRGEQSLLLSKPKPVF